MTPEQIYLLSDEHWCLILPYEKTDIPVNVLVWQTLAF